jgi:hypothetical protein
MMEAVRGVSAYLKEKKGTPGVNPLQAGLMRMAGFRACWTHGEERKFDSAILEAKAAATVSVAQRGSEPS